MPSPADQPAAPVAADLGAYALRGILDGGRAAVRERVVAAWDDFLRVAEGADLQAPTRLPGWRNQEVCTHLGSWPDAGYQPVVGVLEAGRASRDGEAGAGAPDADALNAGITERKRDATRDEVLAALRRNRDQVAVYLEADEANPLDDVSVISTVGALPVLTILHAQTYELAVHALDLAAAGAPSPGSALLDAGLAALTDATGALSVRVGIRSTASVRTELGTWAFRSGPDGWQVAHWGDRQTPPAPFGGKVPVRVEASAASLLDTSAARSNPLVAVVTRKLKVHGLPGLLGLAPIVETVPGIPGGPALRVAARALAGAGGALSSATGALGRLTRR